MLYKDVTKTRIENTENQKVWNLLSSEDRRNTYYSSDTVRKNKFDTTNTGNGFCFRHNYEEQHKQCVDREEHKQKLNVENK